MILNNKKQNKFFNQKLLVHIVLLIGVVVTITPFVWMVLTSLKTVGESTLVPPKILPEVPQWKNYSEVQKTLPFLKFYYNTIVYTVVRTLGQIILCSMAGYAFARIEFPGKKYIFIGLLSVLMIPGQSFLLPQFMIMAKLKLLNTIRALIIPGLFSSFGTFLMRQFFMQIPKEIEEAAILDGCNHFHIFKNIMLPLVRPGIIALAITCILDSWNQLMWPLIVNTNINKMTLSAGIASLSGQHFTNYPVMMAGAVLAIWPMIVVFIIFQKQFIQGLAFTGSKG
ncbi:carbohydrate ABC transporter permease [Paramaledivibacter caminithermalis]|jgi:multiple sugar transport system permease protein|uniref:Multiple sugar transport system permease protein n=1 Tax=Paramaledivibacter caminithermalis (strain DSM 15212 / CIP 107654 / DViRD3) TaxID=1121301 RepID=A0A1M6PJ27_PARC5|nr:carbohydrate ABC transporter permease [Paramaledivibacter caminithermalis]SHK07949.1 multiple sugar transport system permease protein [Paramaledivibacter caminithermalis DSM 15212]